MMDAFKESFRRLDAYPKPLDEFRVRTSSGGVVSIVTIVFGLILFVSQLKEYLAITTTEELGMDHTLNEKVTIHFNITFPHVDCMIIGLDTRDASGGHPDFVEDEIYEVDLDPHGLPIGGKQQQQKLTQGPDTIAKRADFEQSADKEAKPCGSCYGAGKPGQCCNSCAEVKQAYHTKGWTMKSFNNINQCKGAEDTKDNGCLVHGKIRVPKAAGNFHFAPSYHLKIHHNLFEDMLSYSIRNFNATHVINYVHFGAEEEVPTSTSPLKGREKIMTSTSVFQYFLKIVPTDYVKLDGSVVKSNQYSATQHRLDIHRSATMPGVYFFYDLSPIRMTITEKKQDIAHFITDVCAIVGGLYMSMKIVDQVIHTRVSSSRQLLRSTSNR